MKRQIILLSIIIAFMSPIGCQHEPTPYENVRAIVLYNKQHGSHIYSYVRCIKDGQIVDLPYFAGDKGDTVVYTRPYKAPKAKTP